MITIIILLILAGITISSLTNTGLFGRAKEAKEETQNAAENQAKTLNEYEDELNKYISGTTQIPTLADKVKDGTIKVGDYVSYTPDTASTNAILQELGKYSGSDANTTSTLTQEKDLKWRVLDVQNGQVRLISEVPTTSTITLSGAKGYNNAVYLLDKTCKTLYNNSKLTSNVQNLKIEDIQKYLTYDYTQYENQNVDTGKYAGVKEYTTNRYYPNLFAKEKTGCVDGIRGTELGPSEQTYLINEKSTQAGTSVKIIQTFWEKSMLDSDFLNQKYYKLFMSNGSDYPTYWMSSHCTNANVNEASFRICTVKSSSVGAHGLCTSYNNEYSNSFSFRPVVILNSNVKIDNTNTGDGSTAEQAYAIK